MTARPSGLILAVDVQYDDAQRTGLAAGLWFDDWAAEHARCERTIQVTDIAPYAPGRFYLRELPCIEALLADGPAPDLIVVDGYVDLGPDRPGLGRHLHRSCGLPVIGVAKSRFRAADPHPVHRGDSRRPLFVTAAGLSVAQAAADIARMHGPHRMPTVLRRVDQLARGLVNPMAAAP